MNRFQLLACDLDGTLLDSNSKISECNLAAIDELAKRGVHFVPCTGRTFDEIPREMKESGNVRYVIYSNGAAVFDKETGGRMLDCISADTAAKVFDILGRFEAHLTVRYKGKSCIDADIPLEKAGVYYNFWEGRVEMLKTYSTLIPDFNVWKYKIDNIEVISVFFHDADEQEECVRLLSKIKELRIVSACDYNFEIFSITAGKGNALYKLADTLGIDYKETAAVGDSGNDMSVIEAAGIGFAVENATEALKKYPMKSFAQTMSMR